MTGERWADEVKQDIHGLRGSFETMKDDMRDMSVVLAGVDQHIRTVDQRIKAIDERHSREMAETRAEVKELRTAQLAEPAARIAAIEKVVGPLKAKQDEQQSQIDKATGAYKILAAIGTLVAGGFMTFCIWLSQQLIHIK